MVFKAAICPSCGGSLQVPDDRDSVKCMYCGTDIIVRQAIQAGAGVNIHNLLDLAVTAANAENFKEAYDYYSKVLEIDIKNTEAWFGKAKAAGWLSTISDSRFPEVKSGFQNAITYAPEGDKKALMIQCAATISQLSDAYYVLIKNYIVDNASIQGVWENYLSQSKNVISLLEFGHGLNPDNKDIMYTIIQICKNNLEGVKYDYGVTYSNTYGETIHGTEDKVLRVTESEKIFFTEKMNLFSNKLKLLEPGFKTPEIKRKYDTNEIFCICCIVVIVVIGIAYFFTK